MLCIVSVCVCARARVRHHARIIVGGFRYRPAHESGGGHLVNDFMTSAPTQQECAAILQASIDKEAHELVGQLPGRAFLCQASRGCDARGRWGGRRGLQIIRRAAGTARAIC